MSAQFMDTNKREQTKLPHLPTPEKIASELGTAKNIDDFFGQDGIMSRLFGKTIQTMMEAELDEHLGYPKSASSGRGSGNSRNGHYNRQMKSSYGDLPVSVPRDRGGKFKSIILDQINQGTGSTTNELEKKILAMYSRGMTTRDIQDFLTDTYGVELSATSISNITDKIWSLVEEWQNRPLSSVYPIVFLDAIHVKMKREGRVENTAVHIVLGIDVTGHKECLGHYPSDGGESANFWLSVLTDLQNRGVSDILIVACDNLPGFSDAVLTVFPQTQIQKCIVHQIRSSLKYVLWKDRKEFCSDLKTIYTAATKTLAELSLQDLKTKWGKKYAIAVRSWEDNWVELSHFFDYCKNIRKMIYTTNTIESYNRQVRKITKAKSIFPDTRSVRKILYLIDQNIQKKQAKVKQITCLQNWPLILNELVIKFEGRLAI
jgi:transposase-like protein